MSTLLDPFNQNTGQSGFHVKVTFTQTRLYKLHYIHNKLLIAIVWRVQQDDFTSVSIKKQHKSSIVSVKMVSKLSLLTRALCVSVSRKSSRRKAVVFPS